MNTDSKPAVGATAYIGGIGAGLIATLVAGGIWYGVTVATNTAYGVVAMAIGLIAGWAVFLGSGKQRGRTFQLIAAAFGLFGVAFGYFLLSSHWLDIAAAKQYVILSWSDKIRLFPIVLKETTNLIDAVFALIGILYAWRVPRPLPTRPVSAPDLTETAVVPAAAAEVAAAADVENKPE